MLFMTKNSDLVKNDFKTISLKKEIPLKINDIRNSIVAIQELATCSLMKLEKINPKNIHDIDGLAFQIQSIANEVDRKTSDIGDILDDLSPTQLAIITKSLVKHIARFCDIHNQAHTELFPSEWMCEACLEEAEYRCSGCHQKNELHHSGYCNNCVEAYREQVYL